MNNIHYDDEHIPSIIDSPEEMGYCNSPIEVSTVTHFEIIDSNNLSIKISNGVILYKWFPRRGLFIKGEANTRYVQIDYLKAVKVRFDNQEISDCKIFTISIGSKNEYTIEFPSDVVIGDEKSKVNKLLFAIPNLLGFSGGRVKRITKNERQILIKARSQFDTDKFFISIDQVYEHGKRLEELKQESGYYILYGGELKSKGKSLNLNLAQSTLAGLNVFLSFLNGQRTGAFSIHGLNNKETIWKRYSNCNIDSYKDIIPPARFMDNDAIKTLWQSFYKLWEENDDNRQVLSNLVNWYSEINASGDFLDGAILMAQAALELIYNWWVIENKKMLVGKSANDLDASNKIRLILYQLNINERTSEPIYSNLIINNKNSKTDIVEFSVNIRNGITHSFREKRNSAYSIDTETKRSILKLMTWYIEMATLRILDYNGSYFNRITKNLCQVPWKQ